MKGSNDEEVRIVRTGTANVASVRAAFERLGRRAVFTDTATGVRDAERLVLPGVGSFGAARAALDEAGVVDALKERVEAGRPTLAICLGLQLLAEGSEESPGVSGLGIVPGVATRFPAGYRVPQMGWNDVRPSRGEREAGLLREGHAYFANTYRLESAPEGWSVARSAYGGSEFVAALERGAVLACQFHPELSGAFGRALLERWLTAPGGSTC